MKSGTAQHQKTEKWGAEEGGVWGGGVPSPMGRCLGCSHQKFFLNLHFSHEMVHFGSYL